MINEVVVPSTEMLATCTETEIQEFKQKYVLGTFGTIRALTDSHCVFAPQSLKNRVITDIPGGSWCALIERLAETEEQLTGASMSTMLVVLPHSTQISKSGEEYLSDRETLISTEFFKRVYLSIGSAWATKVWRTRGKIGSEDFSGEEIVKILESTRTA